MYTSPVHNSDFIPSSLIPEEADAEFTAASTPHSHVMASLFLRLYGLEAAPKAAQLADSMAAVGDPDSASVWDSVCDTILTIQKATEQFATAEG